MVPAKAPLRSNPAIVSPPESAIFGRPALFFALALFLGVLTIYIFTLSNNFSPDSMSFAILATRGQLGEPLFFQAEHLLYPFVGWLWYQLWVFFGYKQGALIPMQVLNAAGGAAGVSFFFLTLGLLLGRSANATLVGIVSAFLLAGSYGYWFHSTDAEDQIIANALVLATFLLLVVRMRETKEDWYSLYILNPSPARKVAMKVVKSPALLVLTMGLAVVLHGTTVLFLPALLLGLWLKGRDLRLVAVVLFGVVVLAGAAFLIIGGLVHGFRSPGDYVTWLLSAPSVGVWGRLSVRNVWIGAQTMVESFVFLQDGPGFRALLNGVFGWRNTLSLLLFLAFGLLIATVSLYFVSFQRRLVEWRSIALVCVVWFVVVGLFNIYWAPEDIQFWSGLVPPFIAVFSVAYLDLVQSMRPRQEVLSALFVFGFVGVFVTNLSTAMIPRSDQSKNVGLYKTICLGYTASPKDLIITPGWDWASTYGPYFTKLQVLSIVDTYLLSAGSDRAKLFRLMDDRMADTVDNGGKVYVVRLFSLDEDDRAWLKRTTGLTADEIPLKRKPAWDCGGEQVWEVVKQ